MRERRVHTKENEENEDWKLIYTFMTGYVHCSYFLGSIHVLSAINTRSAIDAGFFLVTNGTNGYNGH